MMTEHSTETLTFPKTCHRFFRRLQANNDREWLAAHRDEYHAQVLTPARAFVTAVGERLGRTFPELIADPRANGQGSISRIQRDTRFVADKRPYRTFLGILLWQGAAAEKWDNPSLHLVFTPGRVKLNAGIRRFGRAGLARWRATCGDPKLHRLLTRLAGMEITVGGLHYKRVPPDCEPRNDRHAELLRHRGLFVTSETAVRVGFSGEEFLEFCVDTWRKMAPLNRWLIGTTAGT